MQPITATRRSGAVEAHALERAELGAGLVFGVLADGAGVEHDELGVAGLIGLVVAEALESGGELGAVGGVDLAADGPDVKLRHGWSRGAVRCVVWALSIGAS